MLMGNDLHFHFSLEVCVQQYFVMMMFLLVLMGHNSGATAAAALDTKVSCTQQLLRDSIGGRNLLGEGVLEKIASAYAEAVLSSIEKISQDVDGKGYIRKDWVDETYRRDDWFHKIEFVDHRDQTYESFQKEVAEQLDQRVYHEFKANLRSRNFVLGRMDKLGNAIDKWGGDWALGFAVATPVLTVIGTSFLFFHHGDLGMAFSLPPAAAAAGIISAVVFKNSEDQIHRESRDLSAEFKILVAQKLHERLASIVLENHGFPDATSLGDSKTKRLREIMNNIYKYFVVKNLTMPAKAMGADININENEIDEN
jgi:hypothetical protein